MDAPERIWARPEHDDENSYGGFWIKGPVEAGATEYIRADLAEARIAQARAEEREACARIADVRAVPADSRADTYGAGWAKSAERIAAHIRARGELK